MGSPDRAHAPQRPSSLRIVSCPHVNAPLTPTTRTKARGSPRLLSPSIPSPPPLPPSWSWTCHICNTTYALGVTQRCLNDGHRFCSGVTVDHQTGRQRRHRACGSTFDYVGWKAYVEWRAEAERLLEASGSCRKSVTTPPPPTPSKRMDFLRRALAVSRATRSPLSAASSEGGDGDGTSASGSRSPHSCERHCRFPSECRWNPESRRRRSASGPQPTTPPDAPQQDQQRGIHVHVLDFGALMARLDHASAQHHHHHRQSSTGAATEELPSPGLPAIGTAPVEVDTESSADCPSESRDARIQVTPDSPQGRPGGDKMRDLWWESEQDEEDENEEETETEDGSFSNDVLSPTQCQQGEDGSIEAPRQSEADSVGDDECSAGRGHDYETSGWDWSIGGLGSLHKTGIDMAGLADADEQTWRPFIGDRTLGHRKVGV